MGFALAALVFFGIGDLIYKRGTAAGALPHQLLMVQSWVLTASVTVYGFWTGTLRFGAGMGWGALAGLFMMVAFYNFAHSLQSGQISINAPVFRLSFVITAALALLVLHEPLRAYKVAGITLALVAVWLLLGAPAAQAGMPSRSSLARVLVATAAMGVGNLVYKFGLRAGETPASLIVAQGCTVVMLAAALVAVKDGRIRPSRAALRYAPWAAVVLASGFICMVNSLRRGDASVMVPIAQMGFGVTAVLGFVLFGERVTGRKIAGLAAALAALASFALGQG
jgi:uncharacterized membrane protein